MSGAWSCTSRPYRKICRRFLIPFFYMLLTIGLAYILVRETPQAQFLYAIF